MTARAPEILPFVPRLMSRSQAALYLGVGGTKFDEMVKDGRMPRPRCIDSRRLWDRLQLDIAVEDLPVDGLETESPFSKIA